MSNKETVQKGLDARKDVNAAKEETEQVRKQLEDAGHELVHMRLSHENDKNYWKREKAELVDMFIRERGRVRELEDLMDMVNRREKEAEQRARLVNVLKTAVALVLIVAFRDLDLMDFWLAAALTGLSTGYLGWAVVRLAFSLKK